ncbi:MAG: NAD(P)H-dependent oxidoreductase, partial [Bauldia sp.]
MPKIAVILGSTRQNRFGEKPARWIFDELKKRKGIDAEFIDLRDYRIPFYDHPASPAWTQGPFGDDTTQAFARKIAEADGFIIVAPEYNRGYSAELKNAIDHVYGEWNNKPVAFVSYGSVGGGRAIEQLRLVAIELQMAPIRQAVHIFFDTYMAIMKDTVPVDPAKFAAVQQQA